MESIEGAAPDDEPKTARGLIEMMSVVDLEVLASWWDNELKAKGIAQLLRDYEGDDDIEELERELYALEGRIASLPGKRLLAELRAGMTDMLDSPVEWQAADEVIVESSPSFPSGCEGIDAITPGYGVTCIAGAPKVGKSLLAVSTAVEACRTGWRVILCNAELSRAQVGLRLLNYMGGIDPIVVERLHIANVSTGITMQKLYDEIEGKIDYDDRKLLIVVDSINRVCDMGATDGSEHGYWSLLRDWSAWAMNSRRATEGRISWLIVSELASHGGVKGRGLEYLADLVIRVNATSADNEIVEIDVPLSRGTRSGYVGALRRNFANGRFERAQ